MNTKAATTARTPIAEAERTGSLPSAGDAGEGGPAEQLFPLPVPMQLVWPALEVNTVTVSVVGCGTFVVVVTVTVWV